MITNQSELFEVSTDDLLDELERRSCNFILCVERPDEKNTPQIHLKVGGEAIKLYEMAVCIYTNLNKAL